MRICLEVKSNTNSQESKIEDEIVYVKSPPENNKANQEILKLFSKKYKVPPSDIKIIGKTSKRKKIFIKM